MKLLLPYLAILLAQGSLAEETKLQHTLGGSVSQSTSSLIRLHKSLVERQSTSGSEGSVSAFLSGYLQENGFTVDTQRVDVGRYNVFAYLGDSRKTRVLVTSHIDTVPPFWPYEKRGDEIWGRGTVDAKGSVASQIIAVQTLLGTGEIAEGDVAMLFVVGEEQGGVGMKAFNELGLSWEAVVFGEPTELKLARGHQGGTGFTLRAKGKAGHSGYPEQGRNAIDILVQALSALQQIELPYSERYGNTTINTGTINGGVAANVIPGEALATVSVRIAAGTPDKIQDLIRNAIYAASPYVEVTFHPGLGPVPIDYDIEGKTLSNCTTPTTC